MQAAAASGQLAAPEAVVARLVSMAPLVSVRSFIAVRYAAQMCAKDRCVPHTVRQQVLQELRATPLHQVGCCAACVYVCCRFRSQLFALKACLGCR